MNNYVTSGYLHKLTWLIANDDDDTDMFWHWFWMWMICVVELTNYVSYEWQQIKIKCFTFFNGLQFNAATMIDFDFTKFVLFPAYTIQQ